MPGHNNSNKSQPPFDFFSGNAMDPLAVPQSQIPGQPPPAGALNPFLLPDAFSYNAHLKYLPYRSHPMLLRLLDSMRRQALSGGLQPRHYTMPQDVSVPIAAGDTLYYEQRVARGAVLWGYNFSCQSSEGGHIVAAQAADVRISLIDVTNNHEITAGASATRYIIGSAFRPSYGAGFPFVFMPNPYEMTGNGLIAASFVNTAATARYVQLLLMFAEPGGKPF